MPTPFWRSPDTIEQLSRLDRSGFAVEFLRRNAGYRSDYARVLRQGVRGGSDPGRTRPDLARRWGLRFSP